MNKSSKTLLCLAAALAAASAQADISFYEHDGYGGRSFTSVRAVNDFTRIGFNDRASSVVVRSERWEVCDNVDFGGRCVVLRPGEYPSLASLGLNDRLSSARQLPTSSGIDPDRYAPPPAYGAGPSEITVYDEPDYRGSAVSSTNATGTLRRGAFRDGIGESVVVRGSRSDRWEVCDRQGFRGNCVILRRGQYPSLAALGLPNGVVSARVSRSQARGDRAMPQPVLDYDYGRRQGERLYEANVMSVKAVMADAGQRCWIEREQVATTTRSDPNVPGALLGAVIGGILGHQVGGGSGKDVATGVGIVAGAAIGANAGRSNEPQTVTRDVQRCTQARVPNRVEYYDVTYNFRGTEHRVQMATAPGATVTVNDRGEPRA